MPRRGDAVLRFNLHLSRRAEDLHIFTYSHMYIHFCNVDENNYLHGYALIKLESANIASHSMFTVIYGKEWCYNFFSFWDYVLH